MENQNFLESRTAIIEMGIALRLTLLTTFLAAIAINSLSALLLNLAAANGLLQHNL